MIPAASPNGPHPNPSPIAMGEGLPTPHVVAEAFTWIWCHSDAGGISASTTWEHESTRFLVSRNSTASAGRFPSWYVGLEVVRQIIDRQRIQMPHRVGRTAA
jgi:hypothetical protein